MGAVFRDKILEILEEGKGRRATLLGFPAQEALGQKMNGMIPGLAMDPVEGEDGIGARKDRRCLEVDGIHRRKLIGVADEQNPGRSPGSIERMEKVGTHEGAFVDDDPVEE